MTPQFLPNDIIKDGDYYRRVHGMLGEVVLAGYLCDLVEVARVCDEVYAFHPSDYANWTIVERDGKPYVPTPWKPEYGAWYYFPIISHPDFYGDARWADSSFDNKILERGLVYKTEAEAVAHAERMLKVK